jgi:glutamyl-Q tRNA(Asp) synthetase
MASFLEARQHQGTWLLRIDDLDQARCRSGATEQIIQTLLKLGFHWQEPVQYQHQHQSAYLDILSKLHANNLLYACCCSRQQLRGQTRYPGTCRTRNYPDTAGYALRISIPPDIPTCDDFIVRRRDGVIAYQLAAVVDDHLANITHVVRGADLLESRDRQVFLQEQLGYMVPSYQHVPLVLGRDGKKLSKSDAATPVRPSAPLQALHAAWTFLQSTQPPACIHTPATFWNWATTHWRGEQLC